MKQVEKFEAAPDVFRYTDFQLYLREFYEQRKRIDSTYSFKRFSDLAGLNSPNYLKLVMDGERVLTVPNTHRFAKALGLSFSETSYFESLVHFKQAETKSETLFYRKKIDDARAHRTSKAVRISSKSALLEDPATTAIIVCVDSTPVQNAVPIISKKSGVEPGKIARTLQALENEKLIDVRDQKYELTDKYIVFQDRHSKSANHKRYVRAQLANSIRAHETSYTRDAKFYCNTFTIEESAFPILQERIAEWMDELMADTNKQRPDRVIQLNVQLFPFLG